MPEAYRIDARHGASRNGALSGSNRSFLATAASANALRVGLLTGGSDKPYALGLAVALAAQNLRVEFIGSDELDCDQVRRIPELTFLNLRGDQRENAHFARKAFRILAYYVRLLWYAAGTKAEILHILWNNKFELIDRTALMLAYRFLRKRIVLTAHNVNVAKRDSKDTWLNRATLRIQYRLCHHIFVHTDAMKKELVDDYGVDDNRVTVIPFGINETIPTSDLTREQARERLGCTAAQKTLLFFGQIAPYKGLEYLVRAVAALNASGTDIRLIVAGKVKRGSADYWHDIQQTIEDCGIRHLVVERVQFIPDEDVEGYFKAADAVVLPYVDIFQSGVPFLAFSFGVPVIASDVGSLRDDVVEGTGVLCRAKDAADLARAIERFFASELYWNRENSREDIRSFGKRHHSWTDVGEATRIVYRGLTK